MRNKTVRYIKKREELGREYGQRHKKTKELGKADDKRHERNKMILAQSKNDYSRASNYVRCEEKEKTR